MDKECIQIDTIYGSAYLAIGERYYRPLNLLPFILFLSFSSMVMHTLDSPRYLKIYNYSTIYLSFFASSIMTLIICDAFFCYQSHKSQ